MCINCGPTFGCVKGCPTNPKGKAPTATEEKILQDLSTAKDEAVDHPAYYGGDTPYEVVKVAEAWGFDKDAYLFNVLKYIARPGKGNFLQDLKKARWYLNRKIARLEAEEFEAAKEVNRQQINTLLATEERAFDQSLPFKPAGTSEWDTADREWVRDAADMYWLEGEGGRWYRQNPPAVWLSAARGVKFPAVGSEWIWGPHKPHALCRVRVVSLSKTSGAESVNTVTLEAGPQSIASVGGRYSNELRRFWEAVRPPKWPEGLEHVRRS